MQNIILRTFCHAAALASTLSMPVLLSAQERTAAVESTSTVDTAIAQEPSQEQFDSIQALGEAYGNEPLLISTADLDTHYDPFLGIFQIQRGDGSTLSGSIFDDANFLILARFRVGNGEPLTVSISHKDPLTSSYTVSTSLGDADGATVTTEFSEDELNSLVGPVSVVPLEGGSRQTAHTRQAQLLGIVLILATMACGLVTVSCNDDVAQAQAFCHQDCATLPPEDSPACNDCCYALATGDLINCGRSCGANGPDGDYGNCSG